MTKKPSAPTAAPAEEAGLQRDPDDWKTGDEPMTASQRSRSASMSCVRGRHV
jgi:hypothetical protein